MYMAVTDRITEFYLRANELFYKAAAGGIHAVLIGNDLGAQNGLMLSPDLIRKFVMPGTKKIVEQAKKELATKYGLKVTFYWSASQKHGSEAS
jgi:uroporphyrinogen decarboxylase